MDYNGLVELADSSTDSAAIGKGTFLLADIRETVESGGYAVTENGVTKNYKTYLVRRLADGNCWMVQNLDLNLKTFAGKSTGTLLTPENTDISASRTDLQTSGSVKYWDPSASLRNNTWHTTADPNTTITGGYANHLGQASILEPGPDYDTVGALPITDYQFQDHLNFGRNLSWGSRYQEGTVTENTSGATVGALRIAHNANTEYPRSYNNDLAYIIGDQVVSDQGVCLDTTKNAQERSYGCRLPGYVEDVPGSSSLVTQLDDLLTQDSSWQPELISNSTSDRFTMRGSMYIGDYYNWYAATAETGKWEMASSAAANDSICPTGWKLPSSVRSESVGGSWSYLISSNVYAITNSSSGAQQRSFVKLLQLPLSMPATGHYSNTYGTLYARGADGLLWSSNSYTNVSAIYMYLASNGNVFPQNIYNDNKNMGLSIRCVNKGSNQETVTPTTCSNGQICYNGNGADSGSTASQTASSSADTVLTAPGYVRSGYAFAGWSTSPNGYGTIYGPNESIDATGLYTDGSATSSLTLYAKWIKSSGTMQDFTATQCTNMKEHEVIALTDNRDGNTYSVAKLKDGNCWMTSNLALNLADFAGTQKLTTENTDISPREAKDTYGNTLKDENNQTIYNEYWDPSESMRIVARNAVKDDTTSKYANYSDTYGVSKETLLADLTGYGLTYDDTQEEGHQFTVTDTTKFANKFVSQQNYFYVASEYRLGTVQAAQFHSGVQKGAQWSWGQSSVTKESFSMPRGYIRDTVYFGGYYNFYAAMTETATFSDSIVSPSSVCPSGWQLPLSGGSGVDRDKTWAKMIYLEAGIIDGQAPNAILWSYPLQFSTRTLRFLNGAIGTDGWTAIWSKDYNYAMTYHSTINTRSNSWKHYGNVIRCILK